MNFWHIQLHPNNKYFGKEKEILEKKSIIGLGETEQLAPQIKRFKNTMQIGDIVLVRVGKQPIALVKIISDAFFEKSINHDLDWFQNRRKVEVLKYLDNYPATFPAPTGTLQKLISKTSASFKFIEDVYSKLINKPRNPYFKDENLFQNSFYKGHRDWVRSLIKLDENTIVSASDDNTIKIWNLKEKKVLATLEGHTGGVNSLIKLDENTIVSASDDNTIKIWNLKEKKVFATLEGHTGSVRSLLKLDENTIASASHDKTIRIWDLKGKKKTKPYKREVKYMAYQNNHLFIADYKDNISVLFVDENYELKDTLRSYKTYSSISSLLLDHNLFMFSTASGNIYKETLDYSDIKIINEHYTNNFHIK